MHHLKNSLFIYLTSLLSLVCILSSCEDITESVVPSVKVEATLNTYTTDKELATPGGHKLIPVRTNESPYVGYGGLLVVHGYLDNAIYAYDLACPVENKPNVKLSIIEGIKAKCSQCGSEFDGVFYGNALPSAGKAKENKLILRSYRASFSDNLIHIWN